MNLTPSVVLERNRDDIRRIVLSHRAANPRVFGSVLRGDDTGRAISICCRPAARHHLARSGRNSCRSGGPARRPCRRSDARTCQRNSGTACCRKPWRYDSGTAPYPQGRLPRSIRAAQADAAKRKPVRPTPGWMSISTMLDRRRAAHWPRIVQFPSSSLTFGARLAQVSVHLIVRRVDDAVLVIDVLQRSRDPQIWQGRV